MLATSNANETSLPEAKPAFWIASNNKSPASSLDRRLGANPPSSPTAVDNPFASSKDFNEWNISVPILKDSPKVFTPCGTSINSWKSKLFGAWAPPLITFIRGTGKSVDKGSPKYLYRGKSNTFAAAFAVARLTASIELAPRLDLFLEASISIITWSIFFWSKEDKPHSAGEIISWILFTAFKTPLPM